MTIQELADQSGYHRVSLARLIRTGKVPGVTRKPSGRTKIKDCLELAAWIEISRHKNERRFRNVRYSKASAERRPLTFKPTRFVTAPEVARIIGFPVSRIRRILENYCRPEVRGKRLLYPVTPEMEKWLSSPRKAAYLSRSEDISKLNKKFQRSISRLAGAMMAESLGLEGKDLKDAQWLIVTLIERSQEMLNDLISVAKSPEFQNPEKAVAALNALSDVREKNRGERLAKMLSGIFNGSIPAVPK